MKDFSFNRKEVKTRHGVGVYNSLSDFYSLYRGALPEWIASLYDKVSGGFYFSPAARDTDGFDPDIESTGQALGVIGDLGLTETPESYPEPLRTKAATFLRELQDEDGFFYHPKWGKNINTSRRARDLASAKLFIEMLGFKLKYPSAIEQMERAKGNDGKSEVIPEHLGSKERFISYLDGLEINNNSYSAGQIIAMQAPQIKAVGLADVCIDYLNMHQKENGIWEDELNYASANGMLKICHAYNALGRDLPRLSSVARATVDTVLNNAAPSAIVDVFNPLMSIHYLRNIVSATGNSNRISELEAVLSENAVSIINITRDKLSGFLQPDGSFSYYPRGYKYGEFQWSQGKEVAPGVDEGNMNATQLAKASQLLLVNALGIDAGLPYTPADGIEYFRLFC